MREIRVCLLAEDRKDTPHEQTPERETELTYGAGWPKESFPESGDLWFCFRDSGFSWDYFWCIPPE